MNDQAAQRAIRAALNGSWNEAIEFNLQALKSNPHDTEILNRLARAYAAIGQTKNAHKAWNKVLHLDPYNPIATGQLAKLKHRYPKEKNVPAPLPANTFLDEPGKTKTVFLCRLANTTLLANLEPGEKIILTPKKRLIEISTDTTNQYLGSLPEDLSAHIKKLIKAGNRYEGLIRRVERNSLQIFLKETKRGKRYQNTPSFPTNITSLEPESVGPINETPVDVSATGEENEQ